MTKTPRLSWFLTFLLLFKGLFDLLAGCAMSAGSLLCMDDGTVALSPYLVLLHILGISESSGVLPLISGLIMILCAIILLLIVIRSVRFMMQISPKAPVLKDGLLLIILSLIEFIAGFFSFTSITLVILEGAGILIAVFASLLFKNNTSFKEERD